MRAESSGKRRHSVKIQYREADRRRQWSGRVCRAEQRSSSCGGRRIQTFGELIHNRCERRVLTDLDSVRRVMPWPRAAFANVQSPRRLPESPRTFAPERIVDALALGDDRRARIWSRSSLIATPLPLPGARTRGCDRSRARGRGECPRGLSRKASGRLGRGLRQHLAGRLLCPGYADPQWPSGRSGEEDSRP